MKGTDFPCLLCRQIFKDKDGSSGVLCLVSGDTDLTYDQTTAVYQKRRNAEVFHKSLKSDASLSKPPTGTVRTQGSHFSASVYSFFKPEKLKIKHSESLRFESKTLCQCPEIRFSKITGFDGVTSEIKEE